MSNDTQFEILTEELAEGDEAHSSVVTAIHSITLHGALIGNCTPSPGPDQLSCPFFSLSLSLFL